jgi:menaquinol-cytochrome c reductase iron-sulfur subunit
MNAEKNDTGPAAQPPNADEVSRRKFLERLSITLGGVTAVGLAVPTVGFIMGPLFQPSPRLWRPVGRAESFKIGETVAVRYEDSTALEWAGVTARTAAWLRRESEDKFVAFSVNCTHLGCPVRWLAGANLFMCPCHGGVYYGDGKVAAGPPPRPLTRYPVRISEGNVEILTSPIPIA